jgi:hypothetical protein
MAYGSSGDHRNRLRRPNNWGMLRSSRPRCGVCRHPLGQTRPVEPGPDHDRRASPRRNGRRGVAQGQPAVRTRRGECRDGLRIACLCVLTPQGDNGSADLSYLEAACAEIAAVCPYESIAVNKSTVPVGSTKLVQRVSKQTDVRVVSNPECLRESSALADCLKQTAQAMTGRRVDDGRSLLDRCDWQDAGFVHDGVGR